MPSEVDSGFPAMNNDGLSRDVTYCQKKYLAESPSQQRLDSE